MKHRIIVISLTLALATGFTGLNSTILNAQPTPGFQCSNATVTYTIEALVGLKFNLNKMQVPKASCVQISFLNTDPDIEHDFTIDGKSGPLGMETVYIPAGPGVTNMFNVSTPNDNIIFDFYCSIPGHRAAGEAGDFIVGEIIIQTSTTEPTKIESDLQISEESTFISISGQTFFISLISISTFSLIIKGREDQIR